MLSIRRLLASVLILLTPYSTGAQNLVAGAMNASQSSSTERGPQAHVTLKLQSVTLESAIHAIADQAGLKLMYPDDAVPKKLVSLRVSNVTAIDALTQVLKGTGLAFRIDGRGIVGIMPARRITGGSKGQGVVTGKVVDGKTGKGVMGAKVSLAADAKESVSAEDGSYRIVGVSAGLHTVTVRLVGYTKQSRSVTIGEGATVMVDFKLEPSASMLDQIVVTGTVIPTELKAIPSAITVITAKQLEERGITSIEQLFRGDVPGTFAINQGNWTPLGQVVMFSRGATAIAPSSTPTGMTNPIKTYIDGIEMADPQFLSSIDPRSIERIEILTGPQASTIYGSSALNGVMQVFTKRGLSVAPQLTMSLLSGFVQNNFSSARTPQHDYSAQLSGTEGRISYNGGGSWNYVGPWSPSQQRTIASGFGGIRAQFGSVTADVSFRHNFTQNKSNGSQAQTSTLWQQSGLYRPTVAQGLTTGGSTVSALNGKTMGFTVLYQPLKWWSHEVIYGQDASNLDSHTGRVGYTTTSDTGLALSSSRNARTSIRYSSTINVPIAENVNATISMGGDGWKSLNTGIFGNGLGSLTGSLSGFSISRQPSHNRGAFAQGQLGFYDVMFLTYGLRGEWNPNYGEDAQPNLSPRYGIAYTHNVGALSAKLRASYGKSTQPPTVNQKGSIKESAFFPAQAAVLAPYYGDFLVQFDNPDLGPSYQQGGEGGIELYFGNRASLIVTRFNQTVDGLIAPPIVDSLRSSIPVPAGFSQAAIDAAGYGYWYQTQNLNVGSIRNQGWETKGSVTLGAFATQATYSWTKSRVIGITPRYRPYLVGSQYEPGLPFNFLPEHTWAMTFSYAHSATNVSLTVNGTAFQYGTDEISLIATQFTPIRLRSDQPRTSLPTNYRPQSPGYSTADLNASHRFNKTIDGVLQVVNLTDYYRNEYQASYAVMGRQLKAGFRIRK